MSRSNNTEIVNPAKRFLEWNGSNGGFRYYDKETEAKVSVPLPFKFIVLDTLSTIKGFNDDANSGYWSNEIRDIKKDILTVRDKTGVVAKGLYEHVIDTKACRGAKYCQSVYAGIFEGKDLVIVNIQMVGAALGAWIEFRKKNKVFEGAIAVNEMEEDQKGKTVYQIPVFKLIPLSEESNLKAIELDKELQEYLSKYFQRQSEVKETIDPTTAAFTQDQEDQMQSQEHEKRRTVEQEIEETEPPF